MENKQQNTPPRSRVKKRSSSPLIILILLLLCAGGAYYFFFHSMPFNGLGNNSEQDEAEQTSLAPANGSAPALQGPERTTNSDGHSASDTQQAPGSGGAPVSSTNSSDHSGISTAQDQSNSSDPSANGTISEQVYDPVSSSIEEINGFYTHLDQQQYMKQFGLTESSKVHFSALLQKLMDNPPTVSRETDDLFTLLKNTAHFFRVLGKDNIIILKGILDREKPYVEDILKSFYSLTDHPQRLKEEYQLSLPFSSLYDYAGFFLNTMGGRLYLFRRDSTSRMAVSYYAILIIDKAISEGNSSHGIDLVPAIDFLIEEMETGGKKLTMREDYLDTLYDLKEKYN